MKRSVPAKFPRSGDSCDLMVSGTDENHRIDAPQSAATVNRARRYGISMTDINKLLAGGAIPPEARVVDQPRIEAAVREILLSVGENPDRDGLKETPARVARMYAEIFGGLHVEPGRHLQKVFEEQYDEMVLVRDISFNSMCEHALSP